MRRLFLEMPLAETMQVAGADAHHLANVLRVRHGERLAIRGSDGRLAIAEVSDFSAGGVTLHLVEEEICDEVPFARILLVSLLKGDKLDLVVQKATELGMTRISPVVTAHTIVRYDAAKALKKREKWQKIAVEAAKQCGRTNLPAVDAIRPLDDALQDLDASMIRLFLYEAEEEACMKTVLRRAYGAGRGGAGIACLIGPEGGFSREEAGRIVQAGFSPVTFGRNILRAETASIAACAVIQYESL